MRLSSHLVLAALAIVDCAFATAPERISSRPTARPPESRHATKRQSSVTSDNASIPLPPPTTPTSPPSPVPTPMDLAISYALSDSCLLYLNSILQSSTFKSCLPFSLLLTTSTSYGSLLASARRSGSLESLNELLAYAASPQPSSDQCDQYFSGVYSALASKANCAVDMPKAGTARGVAGDIRAGVGNYKLMREAVGITDPDTGKYCYLQAVTNASPDDLYLWSIPAGISLPRTTTPTCSKCSSLLLNHYSESLDQTPTLNGTTLQSAISIVNNQCGAAFATYTAAVPGAAAKMQSGSWVLGVVAAMAGVGVMI